MRCPYRYLNRSHLEMEGNCDLQEDCSWLVGLVHGISTFVSYLMPNPFLYKSSSSSCRATSTDIPDPLSPLLPIIHRFWQVFRVASRILTQLLYVCSSWSSCFCLVICGGPQEYITDEFVLASPAVSCVSGSSNLYSFRDRRQVAVQLVSCGVLSPGLIQYCSQHSCVIAVQLLLQSFSQLPSSASIQQYRYNHCLEETAFHFIGQV